MKQATHYLGEYLRELLTRTGYRVPLFLALLISSGLIQGAGLMMLIPLLQVIGLGGEAGQGSGLSLRIAELLEFLGVPLTLPMILTCFVLLVAVQAVMTHVEMLLSTSLAQQHTRLTQNRLFRRISLAQWSWIQRKRSSDLAHLLTQDVARMGFAANQAVRLAADVVLSGVYLGVSLAISVPLSLIALLLGLILFAALMPLNRSSYRLGVELRSTSQRIYSIALEHLSSLKLTRSYGREESAIEVFSSSSYAVADSQIRFARLRSLTVMLYQLFGALALAVFIFLAATWLDMPAAEYLVLIVVFARLLPRISQVQQTWQQLRHNFSTFEAAFRAIQEINSGASESLQPGETRLDLKESVRFQNVFFRYSSDTELICDGINFSIPARTVTAIVGPSGIGKTTLADLLIGLVQPEAGEILIDGVNIERLDLGAWRRSIGYVPQEGYLFNTTIRENLLWAKPDAIEDELWEALRFGSAEKFVAALPARLDTIVGDRGGRFSGGERQRLALARALLIKPTLILLDEATSQVDSGSQEQILEAVAALRSRMTVVIIAHHAPVERIADEIILLEPGNGSTRVSSRPSSGVQRSARRRRGP